MPNSDIILSPNFQASEVLKGIAEIATNAETLALTDDTKIISPLKMAQLIATAAEVLTGTATNKLATPAALSGNKSLVANGYYKSAGGWVVQWGTNNFTAAGATISFPTAFSTCFGVVATSKQTSGSYFGMAAHTITASNFVGYSASGTIACSWLAIGV